MTKDSVSQDKNILEPDASLEAGLLPDGGGINSNTLKDTAHIQSKPTYLVGIGASAGGLEALQELIEAIPPETDMAYVIIQHLSPDYRSMMDELLSRKTRIPVRTSEDRMPLEANTIYLLPPKKEMIVSNGLLLLTERVNTDVLNLPINTFLRSMAESYEEQCIAIILSGTGSDGTIGASIVHDNGGMVLVQDPETAGFDGMPNSAIANGKVDLVLAPADMPLAMVKYASRTSHVAKQLANSVRLEENRFGEISLLLNSRLGLDLSYYKPSTITRRIERRLSMQGCSLEDYTGVLMDNRSELDTLYQDLLIGVTHFFRDKPAFQSLRSELSHIIERFEAEEELRFWVAGCATGQEAYTLAMLMFEVREKSDSRIKFKIFATDIHQRSIDKAARGIYSLEEIEGINEQRLERYFTKSGEDYFQVNPEVRSTIVFAQHNLLEDPPFTKIHLLTCRNLLIYFNQNAQQRVLSLFTFALKNEGALFLGNSESLGRHEGDYLELDAKNKIYQKKRESQHRPRLKLNLDRGSLLRTVGWTQLPEENNGDAAPLSLKRKKALDVLLERFVPPSILIDESGNILRVFGVAGRFLSVDAGAPSLNIRSFLVDPAKVMVTQMIAQVKKRRKPVKSAAVPGFAHYDSVDVEIYPLSESPADIDSMLISLTVATDMPRGLVIDDNESDELAVPDELSVARVRELEDELQHTRESLQSTVEELETSNEELQATNEELMAANEEMQTTNEELQSVNEELITVNVEFKSKERQRLEAQADEKSIVDTSGIHILFLDTQLNIRKYSDPLTQLLGLTPEDIGRPFATASSPLALQLLADINHVLNEGGFVEKEFVRHEGEVYHLQIKRLEAADPEQNEPRGVILAFTNISKIHAAQAQMLQSEERLQALLDSMTDGYLEWIWGEDKVYLSEQTRKSLGYAEENQLSWAVLLGNEYEAVMTLFDEHRRDQLPLEHVLSLRNRDGGLYRTLCKGHFDLQQRGDARRARFSGQLIDINRFLHFEDELKTQMRELSRSNEILKEFAHIVSHDLKAPLRHATHSLQYLREALDKHDEVAAQQEMVELRQHMDDLKKMIDDVIRFSRVGSEKKKESMVDLNKVIKRAIDLNTDLVQEKRITITCDELPCVPGDLNMLQHVFQNLIDNACKYNDKDQQSVTICHEHADGQCLIHIEDNGIGFKTKYKENMFKPFRRLVTKEQYEGSGIGLSISKMLVEQHDGEIRCDSILGEGSTFTVQLPFNSKLAH